jgi:hypothetical protein
LSQARSVQARSVQDSENALVRQFFGLLSPWVHALENFLVPEQTFRELQDIELQDIELQNIKE